MKRSAALQVLGVSDDLDSNALRQAYRKLALKHHPDKNPGDPDAERKFKEVVSAYECLTREDDDDAMADVFDSADDMRDFAANFFESFFFGGGFPGFKGGGGGGGKPKRARDSKAADGDKKGSNANSDEDTDDDDYTDDDYDEDYYDDDYSDDDYADLHDFFSQPPPGWRGPPGFRAPKGGSAGGWFGNATGKGSHSGNQFDEYQRARRQREGGSSVDDDELFERLERMRKEAARYAAELAKKEDEARRAKQPLEKLQRPTLVSRTDTSITLNLHRSKNTNQTLPKDRCWELSLTKERERNYSVFTSVKGKTVVTVSDLTPGTRYCFKARVGRVESGESAGVSEWGPYSVESAYATSGKAPPENHAHKASTQHKAEPEKAAEGVVTTNGEDTADGVGSTATLSKKAKKRAAKEKHAAEEAEAAAKGASQAAAETSAAQDRQAALRRAAEAAAEREMAEMEEIRRKMESKKQREKSTVDASLSHQGNAEGHQPTGQPPSGNTEGLSKKALQRKKKKEKLAAETAQRLERESASAAAVTDEEFARRLQAEEGGYAYNPGALESDEALARRLQAEEDKYKTHAPPTTQPPTQQQPYNPVQAAPAMPMPKGRTQPQYAQPTTQSAFGAASNAAAAPPLPRGAPPPPPPGGPPPNANRLPPPKASAAPGPFGAPPPQQTYGGHPPPLPPGPHPGPTHPHGQYGGGPPPLPPGAPPPPPGGPPPVSIGGGGMRPNPYAANTAPNPYDPYANPYSNVHEYGQSSVYHPAQQVEDGFTRTHGQFSAPDPWAAINGDGGEDGADAGFELPFNGGFELPSDDDFVGAVRDHAETRPTQRIQRGPGSVPHPNGGSQTHGGGGSFHAGSPQDGGLFVPGTSTHAAWSSSPPGDGRGGTGHHDSIHHAHSNGYGYDSSQQQRHDSAYTANGYGYDSGQQYPQRQYQNAPGSSPPVGSFGNDSYGGAFGTSPGSAYGGSFGGGGGVWSGLESGRQPPASSSGAAKRGGLGGVSLEGDMDALNLGGGSIFPPGGSSFSFLEENGGN